MHVSALHVYPIKGCRGTVLSVAEVGALGIEGDRRFMVVGSDDRFLSQREAPALATIAPALDGPMLTVRRDGMAPLSLEVDPSGTPRRVGIWRSEVLATDQGDAAAQWFSAALGRPVRLVHFGAQARRPIDPAFSPRPDAETSFTDGYPLLVVLEESLAALNRELEQPVPMGRFRPSLVIHGGEAWAEAEWGALRVGDVVLDLVKPCARCVVTTTDQLSGARHPAQEPLRTLARLRTIPRFGAIFGQNAVPRGPGRVAVGDGVAVDAM